MFPHSLHPGSSVIVNQYGYGQLEHLQVSVIKPTEVNGLSGFFEIHLTKDGEHELVVCIPGDRVMCLINGLV